MDKVFIVIGMLAVVVIIGILLGFKFGVISGKMTNLKTGEITKWGKDKDENK